MSPLKENYHQESLRQYRQNWITSWIESGTALTPAQKKATVQRYKKQVKSMKDAASDLEKMSRKR